MFTPIPIKRNDEFYSNYWEGYSPKLKRDVDFFGDLRYEYWLLIETNPDIVSFCERPISIEGVINGKKRRTQFDMWLKWKDGRDFFVKVIYSSKKESFLREVEELWCKNNGYEYLIVTEQEIRSNPIVLSNKKQLLSSLGNRVIPIEIDILKITKQITEERTTIKLIIDYFKEGMPLLRIKEALYWMIYQGIISSNMDEKPLSPETEVWLNVKTKDHRM
ncbi:MAG: Tn7 transposase TnsA N-terminal domain-containing protein [Bacillaceae bacterium]|nr:Tn7 transposase TnsA N-terminal domain-containing protein [Bacillaceae bacterium]